MIASALLLAAFVTGPAQTTADDQAGRDREAFARQVAEYRLFVEPLCAPRAVGVYASFNRERDMAFRASLPDTELEAVYRTAIREWREREARTVRHCQGPPPPPPPPGAPSAPFVDPRTSAIEAAQKDIRDEADAIPRHFDLGDADFAKLVELRDRILSRGNR